MTGVQTGRRRRGLFGLWRLVAQGEALTTVAALFKVGSSGFSTIQVLYRLYRT
jgi:hypothetical protein